MRFIRECLMAASFVLVLLDAARAQSITIGSATVYSGGNASEQGNRLSAQIARLPEAATIESLSFYVIAASGNLALGIYDATGPGGGPGSLKASTYLTPTKGWNTSKVKTPVSLPAGAYWLAFLPSSNALGFLETHLTGDCKYYSFQYNALPGKFSTSPASCNPTTWSFYATLAPVSTGVAGRCGAMNGLSTNAAPTWYSYPSLCAAGAASAVSGSGPWGWTCAGSNGGANASCQAPVETTLPLDRSAAANWRSAGMLSRGGIPNRTAVCKTLSALGGGKDDLSRFRVALSPLPRERPYSSTRASRCAGPVLEPRY